MRQKRLLAVGLLLAAAGGCVERTLTIRSNPEGALVYLNGEEIGRTPVTTDFTWYGDYDVVLRKPGSQTLKTHQGISPPLYDRIPLDLFAELAPWRVKVRRTWDFDLQPATTQPDPDSLMARAEQLKGQLQSSERTRAATRPTTRPSTQPASTQPARDR